MGTYGRNFDFRQSPLPQHRLGRLVNGDEAVPQGAPVIAGTDQDDNGRREFTLAPAGTDRPVPGAGGIALYEQPDANYRGQDATLTRPSDMTDVPAGVPAQMCHGTETRLLLVNTDEDDFRGMRDPAYPARKMVAGVGGATPTVDIGDYLGPGDGNDTDGYWKVVASATDAWAYVTGVDHEAGFCEAQLLF